MRRCYVDTIIIERPDEPLVLLSVGIVDDQGRTYYAQNHRARLGYLSPWQLKHVLPNLEHPDCWSRLWSHEEHDCPWKTPALIREEISAFVDHAAPDFWGEGVGFGYVVLRQLMEDAWQPEWPDYINDVEQVQELLGCWAVYPPRPAVEHALARARWVRAVFERIKPAVACAPDALRRYAEYARSLPDDELPDEQGSP